MSVRRDVIRGGCAHLGEHRTVRPEAVGVALGLGITPRQRRLDEIKELFGVDGHDEDVAVARGHRQVVVIDPGHSVHRDLTEGHLVDQGAGA